jgi:protein SCO1
MSRITFITTAIVLAVAAAVAGAWFAARLATPELPEHARILPTPRPLPEVPAVDHSGAAFSSSDFEGRWTVVFFGFTYCPDICPATLHVLASVRRALDDLPQGDRPDVMMISVDPERDSPQRLAEYIPFFHPDFLGLHVPAEHLPELARAFSAAYFYMPLDDDNYTVDHTTSLFLVDPGARVSAVIPTPHVAEVIASDYRRIIKLENSR